MTNRSEIQILTELAEEFEAEAAAARAISRGIANNGMTYNGHAAAVIREKIARLTAAAEEGRVRDMTNTELVLAAEVVEAEIVEEGPGTCEAKYPGCTGRGYVQQDPYAAEINDEIVFGVWCDECVYEMAMDI